MLGDDQALPRTGIKMPEMKIRSDIDYKILSMRINPNINYKILDAAPKTSLPILKFKP